MFNAGLHRLHSILGTEHSDHKFISQSSDDINKLQVIRLLRRDGKNLPLMYGKICPTARSTPPSPPFRLTHGVSYRASLSAPKVPY